MEKVAVDWVVAVREEAEKAVVMRGEAEKAVVREEAMTVVEGWVEQEKAVVVMDGVEEAVVG